MVDVAIFDASALRASMDRWRGLGLEEAGEEWDRQHARRIAREDGGYLERSVGHGLRFGLELEWHVAAGGLEGRKESLGTEVEEA